MHLFFDLDGTLTNPRQGILACIRHALVRLNRPIPADDELAQWIGPPLQDSFLTLLGHRDLADQAVSLYRDRFATVGLFENQVYDHIPEILTILSQTHTLWVTTAKPTVFAAQIIQHFQLASFFVRIYGSELDGTRTDKADLLAHVLQAEQIDPAKAIMVGDRRHDILGASQHGIPTVGVLWGFGSAAELKAAGATAVCEHPIGLPDSIQTIWDNRKQPLPKIP